MHVYNHGLLNVCMFLTDASDLVANPEDGVVTLFHLLLCSTGPMVPPLEVFIWGTWPIPRTPVVPLPESNW